MKQIQNYYIADTSFISPLGLNADENMNALIEQKSGIRSVNEAFFYPKPVLASVIGHEIIQQFRDQFNTQTRFDSMLLACADDMLRKNNVHLSGADCLIILSTTKGNVELLAGNKNDNHADLNYSASLLRHYLNNPNPVLIVSNACISGVSASIAAGRYLDAGRYRHVLVIGCDTVSRFVLSGFSSFHAVSKAGCRPFDRHRDGVVLGEACGAILYSAVIESDILLAGGTISNDANHISGPSRTGEELAYCIGQTLHNAQVNAEEIDFISAHGTATQYNDEMESKAIEAAGLNDTPVFSLKGHYGHTLGASGVIECIVSIECLKRNIILPSYGFEEKGVSGDITINKKLVKKEIQNALKTTSGFGGCNAALLLKKNG